MKIIFNQLNSDQLIDLLHKMHVKLPKGHLVRVKEIFVVYPSVGRHVARCHDYTF